MSRGFNGGKKVPLDFEPWRLSLKTSKCTNPDQNSWESSKSDYRIQYDKKFLRKCAEQGVFDVETCEIQTLNFFLSYQM